MNRPAAGEMIVMSRLLVLQSKRILFASMERRLHGQPRSPRQGALQRLRAEMRSAHDRYLDAVLKWGSPDSSQFWLVAYGDMIEGAEVLALKLRETLDELPPADRVEVRGDIAQLKEIIERWRSMMRPTMSGEVA